MFDNDRNFMESEKLTKWMRSIFDNAIKHGWHDHPLSKEHYMGLIMTEMAEAVEADRHDRRALTQEFIEALESLDKNPLNTSDENFKNYQFMELYRTFIKGTIEEEFADVVTRILDMAWELHGEKMVWRGYCDYGENFNESKSFVENAWIFLKEILESGTMNISDSVSYMYAWSDWLEIDLDKHIEWKMHYNELREYKHGGKKY